MSTVLEALRQSEGRGDPGSRRPPDAPRWKSRPAMIAVVAIVAGAAAALIALVSRTQPPPAATETSPAARAIDAAKAPVDLAMRREEAPRPPTAMREEAPWARVHAPPAATPRPAAQPRAKPEARPAAPPARSRASESAVVPSGSQLILDSIDCSAGRSACRARFLIDGRLVSLGAGERSGDVEVQLILSDVAYVRQGGTVVALQAPP